MTSPGLNVVARTIMRLRKPSAVGQTSYVTGQSHLEWCAGSVDFRFIRTPPGGVHGILQLSSSFSDGWMRFRVRFTCSFTQVSVTFLRFFAPAGPRILERPRAPGNVSSQHSGTAKLTRKERRKYISRRMSAMRAMRPWQGLDLQGGGGESFERIAGFLKCDCPGPHGFNWGCNQGFVRASASASQPRRSFSAGMLDKYGLMSRTGVRSSMSMPRT